MKRRYSDYLVKFLKANFYYIIGVILAIFLIYSVAFILDDYLKEHYTQKLKTEYQALVENTVDAIAVLAENHGLKAKSIADEQVILDSTKKLLLTPVNKQALLTSPAQKKLRTFFEKTLKYSLYKGYFIVDKDNNNLASSQDLNIGIKNLLEKEQPSFLTQVRAGKVVVSKVVQSDVYLKTDTNRYGDKNNAQKFVMETQFVGVPIRDKNGRVIAVLLLRLNPYANLFSLFKANFLGRTGDSFAFDDEGKIITPGRFSQNNREPHVKRLSVNPEKSSTMVNASGEQVSRFIQDKIYFSQHDLAKKYNSNFSGFTGYSGADVIAVWHWDKALNLGVAFEIDKAEAYAFYDEVRIMLYAAATLSLFLLLILSLIAIRSQYKLYETKQRISAIIETASDAVILIDQSGIIESINPATEKIFGYSKADLIGKNINMLMPAPIKSEHDGYIKKYLETKASNIIGSSREVQGKASDGRLVSLVLSINPIELPSGTHFAGFLKDLTKLKEYEKALRLTNEKLMLMATVFENAKTVVIVTDAKQNIILVNPYFEKITGYSQAEVLGKKPNLLQGPETSDVTRREIRAAITAKEHISIRILNYRKDGQLMWFELYIIPCFNEQHEVTHFVSVQRDVTEELRIENQLKLAKEAAETANQAKSNFLATMSHEIRTPLNGIIATLDMLNLSHLNHEQMQLIHTATDSSVTLMSIINDILDFSKIEAGKLEFEQAPMLIHVAMDETATLLLPLVWDKNIILFTYCDPTIGCVNSDVIRIKQIMNNLLSNAIKFTQTTAEEKGKILFFINKHQETDDEVLLRIDCIDNGIGMNEETKRQILKPFIQAEVSTTREYGGTGLGLSIVERLASLLGGSIELNSTEHKGTIISVYLPLQKVLENKKSEEPKLDNKHILLMSDDKDFTNIVSTYVSAAGAEVHRINETNLQTYINNLYHDNDMIIVIISFSAGFDATSEIILKVQAAIKDKNLYFIHATQSSPSEISEGKKYPHCIYIGINAMKKETLIYSIASLLGIKAKEPLHSNKKSQQTLSVEQSLSREDAIAQGKLLLLADDNSTNQKVIKKQLEILGFYVDIADDGKMAFEMCQKIDYALIFTDCHMPVMDGYEFTAKLRQAKTKNTQQPVIAITADALKGTKDKCLSAGMNDYLTKPIQLKALQAAITKWLKWSPDSVSAKRETVEEKTSGALIDTEYLKNLLGITNSEALLEYYQNFLASSTPIIAQLQQQETELDFLLIKDLAHKLKSSSRTIGAHELAVYCEKIEQLSKLNKRNDVVEGIQLLLKQYEQVKQWIDNYP